MEEDEEQGCEHKEILFKLETSTSCITYSCIRGGDQMGEIKIVNYINIDGKDVLLDSLPEDVKTEIAIKLTNNFMRGIGYRGKAEQRRNEYEAGRF